MTSDGRDGAPGPGWYTDPDGAGLRWWDGQRWTQHEQGLNGVGSGGSAYSGVGSATSGSGPGSSGYSPVGSGSSATSGSGPGSSGYSPVGSGSSGYSPSGPGISGYAGADAGGAASGGSGYAVGSAGSGSAGSGSAGYGGPGTSGVPYSSTAGLDRGGPPLPPGPGAPAPNPSAVLGLLLALGSLVLALVAPLGAVPSIVAMAVSQQGLRRAQRLASAGHRPTGRGTAMAGLVLGGGVLLLTLFF